MLFVPVPTLERFFTWHLNGLLNKTNHLDVFFFLINIDGGPGRLNELLFSHQGTIIRTKFSCNEWSALS